ncbi:carbohydrate kinase family protein [Calditrichota bacterium]
MTNNRIVDVFGLGHCCVDHLCLFDIYPEKGKKGDVSISVTAAGGPVPTALTMLASYGVSTAFAGIVGDDANGKLILQHLEEAGVDVSACKVDPHIHTPTANIWIDSVDGSRTIALDTTGHRWLKPDEFDLAQVELSKIFLSDCRATELNLQALQRARAHNIPTVIDVGSFRERFAEMLPFVDYAVVSQDLSDLYSDDTSPESLADWLLKQGAACAIVTCGAAGALLKNGHDSEMVPGFKVDAIDTTGAGDLFHGAFVYQLLRDKQLVEVIRFANAVSALACTRLSGVGGILDVEDIMRFIEHN